MEDLGNNATMRVRRRGTCPSYRLLPLLMLLALAIIPVISLAANVESAETLRQIARTFLGQQVSQKYRGADIDISIGRLDSRLQLSPCKDTPEAFLPTGSKAQGKLTIGLRCSSPKPWTVYLPARIRVFTEVISTARTLSRGTSISPADIVPIRAELSELRYGYFLNKEDVIGKVVKRTIKAGTPLSPHRIKEPLLVRRGEEVTIVAVTGALKVRVKGKAMQDAIKGQIIPVRNNRSKRIVQAVAVESGTVSVRM